MIPHDQIFSKRKKTVFICQVGNNPLQKSCLAKARSWSLFTVTKHSRKCEILTHFFIFTLIILKRRISRRMCSHFIDDKGSFTTCLFQILIFTTVFHWNSVTNWIYSADFLQKPLEIMWLFCSHFKLYLEFFVHYLIHFISKYCELFFYHHFLVMHWIFFSKNKNLFNFLKNISLP